MPKSPRARWPRLGALLASASLGSATFADAAPNRNPAAPAHVVVARLEGAISRWVSPQALLEAAYRTALVPGETGPGWLTADPPADQVIAVRIGAGPLADAIRELEALTGVTVQAPADLIVSLTTGGASGRLSLDQVLDRLLAGTGLTYRVISPRLVVIELRVSGSSVDVTASLPVVTSAKFPASLIDTPQTITVVPRQVIEAQGATTLRDVLRNVPGVTMQAGEGGGGLPGDTMTIRGFSASGDIFVDGIRDVGAYSRDAFNLEQVEVVKGPASTFGGRGSTGAAINMATKSPRLASMETGSVTGGSAGTARTTVDINEPLKWLGDGAAFRVNAMWQDAGVPGRDVVNNRSWAVAPSLAVGLSGPTRATVAYQHLEQDNVPDYGLPWGASTDPATGGVYPTGAFNATPAIDQANFYGLRNYDFERITNDVATVRLDRDWSEARFSNVVRFSETFRDSAITAPRPPNRQLQRREMRNSAFANQSSLGTSVSTGAIRHDLSAGLDLARETTFSRNSAQTTNQPQTNIRTPNPDDTPFGPMPAITGNPGEATTSTVGAYLFDTAALGRRVQVSGGVRWDHADVGYRQTTLATGAVTELGRTDSMVSWRGGLVYKPSPSGSVYLGYGTSFNPASEAGTTGTALSGSDTAVNSVTLEPERSRNLEVGAKWAAFQDRMAVTGALFRTEKTNARTRNLANEPFVLAGRQRVQGLELGVSGQIAPGLTGLASFAWMNSRIVESANPVEDGRDLALTPERTASIWATWQVRRRVTVGGGAQFMDAIFRNTTTDLSVPAYWLVNAMGAYDINAHLSLRVNATNLTNEQYVDRVGGGHYVPGPRRAIQVTTSVGF